MKALTSAEVTQVLTALDGWSGDTSGLTRKIVFNDFREAMAFMAACVDGIDTLNHHPDWRNVYNSVDIRLSTHDLGDKVSEKDVELARLMNDVLRA